MEDMKTYLKKKSATKGSRQKLDLANERLLGTGLSITPANRDQTNEFYDRLNKGKGTDWEANDKAYEQRNKKQYDVNQKQFDEEANPEAFDEEKKRRFLRFNRQLET